MDYSGSIGLAIGGLGLAYSFVTATKSDEELREEDVDRGDAVKSGLIAAGLGLLVMTPWIVDSIRLSRTDVARRDYEELDRTVAPDVACDTTGMRAVPAGWTALPGLPKLVTLTIAAPAPEIDAARGLERLKLEALHVALGTTLRSVARVATDSGRLELLPLIEAGLFSRSPQRPTELEVSIDGHAIGRIRADALLAASDA